MIRPAFEAFYVPFLRFARFSQLFKSSSFWFIDGVNKKTRQSRWVSMLTQQNFPLFCFKFVSSLINFEKFAYLILFTSTNVYMVRAIWFNNSFHTCMIIAFTLYLVGENSFVRIAIKLLFSNNLIWQNKQQNYFFSFNF